MMQFHGRIPIVIYPAFWIFAALIGFLNSGTFAGTLIWIGIILVSVLFHELGHALTALLFKQNPRIELVALGGLTYHNGSSKLKSWKQFLIVLNGPLFGFLLVIVSTILLMAPGVATSPAAPTIHLFRLVNLFWTCVNLLPVLPLDGGQLVRIALEKWFGAKAFRYSIIVSLVVAALISLTFFLLQAFLIGALFFLFGFQSYSLLRKTRHFMEVDRNDHMKEELQQLEMHVQKGETSQAIEMCNQIRNEVSRGVIYETATQYLALFKAHQNRWKEVYELLLPMKKDLSGELLCFLHRAAFEEKNYDLVIDLAGPCFQFLPNVETAMHNAYAHAQKAESQPALGWLQTARDEGLSNLKEVLEHPLFDPIRDSKAFQQLITKYTEAT